MAFTLQDLDALDNAIKTGRQRVKYGDKEVLYRSMSEMMQARLFIVGELTQAGLLSAAAATPRTSFTSFGRE